MGVGCSPTGGTEPVLVEVVPPPVPTTPLAVAPRAVGRAVWRRVSGWTTPLLYLVPALAGLVIWVYKPLAQTVQYSFTQWDLLPTNPQRFVGWSNYHRVLALPQLWAALRTTGIFVGGMLVLSVLVPVVLAVLTQQVGARARGVYRAIVFVPVLVSPVVAATMWSYVLAPNGGLADQVLGWFGVHPVNWLADPGSARFSVVMISGWKLLGFSVLIVSAGLAAISGDYYEAAEIDGASRWQAFRSVTLPLLSPTILFLVITSVLLSSQIIFPLLNSLTQGGPAGATTDVYFLLYEYGFSSFDVGLASAAAVLFFLLFGLIALVGVRLLDRFSFYDN